MGSWYCLCPGMAGVLISCVSRYGHHAQPIPPLRKKRCVTTQVAVTKFSCTRVNRVCGGGGGVAERRMRGLCGRDKGSCILRVLACLWQTEEYNAFCIFRAINYACNFVLQCCRVASIIRNGNLATLCHDQALFSIYTASPDLG